MRITDTSHLLLFAYVFLIGTVTSHILGGNEHFNHHQLTKSSDQCEDSKLIVNPSRNITYIRIITNNGQILFSIDSTRTAISDIDGLISNTRAIFFQEPSHVSQGNSSVLHIVKHPIVNGIKVELFLKFNKIIFEKEIHGSNEGLKDKNVKCAHLTGLKVIVEQGLDPNHRGGYNMSPFLWAVLFGEEELTEDLVKKGADINSPVADGSTPLIAAMSTGKDELVKYLITHGANVNKRVGPRGVTPLHVAIQIGRLEWAKTLLDNGANASSTDAFDETTPLHYAISRENTLMAKLLIARGADVNAKMRSGMTPLHAAVIVGNEELIQYLLQSGADINVKDNENNTPLILAVLRQRNESLSLTIVKHLVEHHNPEVNIRNVNGFTALSIASKRGFKKVQNYLKAHGAI